MNKTKQAMLATTISIFSMLFVGILTILRTGLIVKNISSDVNALSQISNQLFSYLVLLESGLGSAYTFKMYKPLSKLQYDKVYSLFLGLKYTLKKIAKKYMKFPNAWQFKVKEKIPRSLKKLVKRLLKNQKRNK